MLPFILFKGSGTWLQFEVNHKTYHKIYSAVSVLLVLF